MKPAEFIFQENKAARRIHRGRLFRKYFVSILALVCGVLLVSGGISVYFSYQENKSALASLQQEKAVAAASRIEQFVKQVERQLGFAAVPQLGADGGEQRRLEFLKLLNQVPAVTDIAQLDSQGRELIMESRLAMSVAGSMKDRSRDPAFLGAKPGQTWFGPVAFRKETEPYMTIAMRSRGANGQVTVADINLKFIWDVVTRIKIGQKGKAYVVDSTGHLIADPDIGLVLRKTDLSMLGHVKAALAGPGAEAEPARLGRDLSGKDVLTAFASVDSARTDLASESKSPPLGWKVFVEQPVSEVYATLNATIVRTAMLMVAGLLFSALTALWLARGLVRPIRTLQEGAQRIGEGELDQKIDIKTGDELEALADQFNRMTSQLRESYAELERKVEERTAELTATLSQQTATADVLKLISRATFDLDPVLQTLIKSAAELCDAQHAIFYRVHDDGLRPQASYNVSGDYLEYRKLHPIPVTHKQVMGRVMLSRAPVHVHDVQADSDYDAPAAQKLGQYRTVLGVPVLREGVPIGVIGVFRQEVRPFLDRQISLVTTFADQAAIAIENVRLFNETRESLEQQTATSDILRVISSSPTDVQPVFEAIAQSGLHLFGEANIWVVLRDGDTIRAAAISEREPDRVARWRGAFPTPLTHDYLNATAILDSRIVDITDVDELPKPWKPGTVNFAATGYKAVTITPMMRGTEAIGAIGVARLSAGALSEKQVALLKTFADQAVIAIENVRLFNEIQDKSRQLEIAGKHKSEFLANMSHELRTPLNAIIGFSEVLLDKMFGELNPKQEDYLKDIFTSGKHLLSLINDILDLSKIEAGRMDLEPSNFDVPNALANALTLIRERATRHSIELDLKVDPAMGELKADERKFKQILLNLLSNAVKFTPDGGKVEVSAKKEGGTLEVAVSDTGIGIAPEDQSAVFEEFRQVGRHYTNKNEGTGLGLALTKRFVELHGGRLWLESEPGKGSTFTFTIPGQA